MRISSFYVQISRGASKSKRQVPIIKVATIGVGTDKHAHIIASQYMTPRSCWFRKSLVGQQWQNSKRGRKENRVSFRRQEWRMNCLGFEYKYGQKNMSSLSLLPCSTSPLAALFLHIDHVWITTNQWFVSTRTNSSSMTKCLVSWISLSIRIRSRNTQPYRNLESASSNLQALPCQQFSIRLVGITSSSLCFWSPPADISLQRIFRLARVYWITSCWPIATDKIGRKELADPSFNFTVQNWSCHPRKQKQEQKSLESF